MRIIKICLIIALCFSAGNSLAMDMLLGTVVAVDSRNRIVLIEPFGKVDDRQKSDVSSKIEIRLPGPVPSNIREGSLIRIWGDYSAQEQNVFTAIHVRDGGSLGRMHDPTGVRDRLGRGFGNRRSLPSHKGPKRR